MTRSPLRNRLAAWVALLFGLALASAVPASAQASEPGTVTWGISPAAADGRDARATITHVVEPGQELVDHVVVDNHSESPITLDLYASDARPADGEFDVLAADETSGAVGAWVELDEARVEIPAGDHVIVPVTVRIPVDAEPGDHAGGILASRRATGESADVGIETERRVGARVHLRVTGPIRPELTVEHLEVGYGHRATPLAPGRVEIAFRVRNTGNIRLSADTSARVEGPFGTGRRSQAGQPVEDLLPGHWVDRRIVVDGAWPLGRLTAEAAATPTASAGQGLDGAVDTARARSQVWAPPYAALVVVMLAAGAAVALRRRRRRRGATPSADPPDLARPSPADGDGRSRTTA